MADSRIDVNNSSDPGPNPFLAGQQAILDAEMASQAQAQRVAEANVARAKRAPLTNGMQNAGIQATYDAHGQPSLPNPKKGKKG